MHSTVSVWRQAFAQTAHRATAIYAPGYYAAYLLNPDGNNVEALYRDVGNPGHAVRPSRPDRRCT
jgi:hypothetical protein